MDLNILINNEWDLNNKERKEETIFFYGFSDGFSFVMVFSRDIVICLFCFAFDSY